MKNEMRSANLNIRIQNFKYDIFIEEGKSKIRLSFTNCSYGTITAMKFIIHGYNSFSEPVLVNGNEAFTIIMQDLNIPPLQFNNNIVSELPNGEIRKAEVTTFQICYDDGNIIEVEEPEIIEYEVERLQSIGSDKDKDISENEQLLYIKNINSNAVCYPANHSNGWVCICGELNREENERCVICGSEKELIFKKCSKETVIKKCEEEREHKKAEEEKRIEEQRLKQLVEIKKKRQTIIAVAIAVVMCVLVIILWRVIYVRTYGMDAETHAQWETALQEYKEWENAVVSAWYGEGGYNDVMKNIGDSNYTYSEIYSMKSLDAPRNAVLDKVGEIDLIVYDFPEKYRPVISKLAECQKTVYVIDMDVTTVTKMCDVMDFLSSSFDQEKQLKEDIERLESYLEDEYLHTDNMDLSTSVSLSYSPRTFSYSYSLGGSYDSLTLNSSEIISAKSVADSYCRMLINKQSSISTITYIGTSSGLGSFAFFEYKVTYNDGTTRIGTVTVQKNSSSWKAIGMDFD